MAISTLNRLSSQFNRLPSLSPFTKSLLTRSSAKVADRIVKLSAIDPDGQKREIVGLSGQTLLKALTNNGLIDPASHRLEEIEACSAECEVNIAEEWLEKLPPRSYDEEYVLKRNSRTRVLNKHSRLGCQVVLTQDLQGMVVAVPEPKPWDIPFPFNWASYEFVYLEAFTCSLIFIEGVDEHVWLALQIYQVSIFEKRKKQVGKLRITCSHLYESVQLCSISMFLGSRFLEAIGGSGFCLISLSLGMTFWFRYTMHGTLAMAI
ncbi:hypothetical protein DKX38_021658 [Salix brachista]|uniref:2Fe-2S ferredoxin-type domain-containing protein n=1 Tax=Salix brachista TaxID=2182728 RepID=A0A5N5K842_9ROSI|nr:hypothetical protein DKX38_021658 [Salix brachista]